MMMMLIIMLQEYFDNAKMDMPIASTYLTVSFLSKQVAK